MNKKAFFLKINRKNGYAIKNLSRWIDAAYLLGADCYIVCDDDNLKEYICKSLLLYSNPDFIRSQCNDELKYIVDSIANRNWKNAAYAHLTTFFTASEQGYEKFWNIDADDTRICLSIDRMAELLTEVENYAEKHSIDVFSLDMWRSGTEGRHWSFGVTYVNNKIEWLELCKIHCKDMEYQKIDNEGNQNVDWFFTYLKTLGLGLRIETFYVEKLRFIHYADDFVEKPIASGMYHWENNELIYPFLCYGFDIKSLGNVSIASDVIKIDINIKDEEARSVIAFYAREGKDLSAYYDLDYLVNTEICEKKWKVFCCKHNIDRSDDVEVICFGAGNALVKNEKKIRKITNITTVCDNDEKKWGKSVINNIRCISPNELAKKKNVIVVILVYSKNIVQQIEKQLTELGMEYDFMDNWFACVE